MVKSVHRLIFFIGILVCVQGQNLKIMLLKEHNAQQYISDWVKGSLGQKIEVTTIELNGDENDHEIFCDHLKSTTGLSLIVDLTWTGNEVALRLSDNLTVPYVQVDVSIGPLLLMLDRFLELRNSTDVTLIFDDPEKVDEALYYWIDTTLLRMMISENLDHATATRLKNIRPLPNNFAIVATSPNVVKLYKVALEQELVKLPERWNLLFLDFESDQFDRNLLNNSAVNLIYLDEELCCRILGSGSPCDCPHDLNLQQRFFGMAMEILARVITDRGQVSLIEERVTCDGSIGDTRGRVDRFYDLLQQEVAQNDLIISRDSHKVLTLNASGNIESSLEVIAKYGNQRLVVSDNKTISPVRAFYRIGITYALPWSYKEIDDNGNSHWTGYCVDFAEEVARLMNFDYEFVEPESGTFGKKRNGVYDGVIGDLASGETEMAFTALIMTADREEVVDFVPPYFEQTGITIVMRKPVRKTSLFKFMTVLKLEVWLSIVGALIVTGFMVWFLDKYSPYSARNNKKSYPYPCREFTLKESFWFALTSFTPQGGGEAPKALSGRTLVAAYWLFVVLMLATFTANLAAFLTVERMQTPVQSLEQLAKQSRINYTVVKESDTHIYFINMKNAEDALYRMWKELTLNASTDDTQYRVWDYPIREQYGHILLAINDSNPVANASEGFRIVDERTDADFAFIHDSSEIRYEISRNCNLTEVGEVFAEKPYAVAVQQGSHLQDEISKAILNLQKDRFFEQLQAKYWNHSAKGSCPSTDDNEGITLESLGGVFIATLFGLALAMVTLVGEVLYYRRKRVRNQNQNGDEGKGHRNKILVRGPEGDLASHKVHPESPITIGTEFRPVNFRNKDVSELAHITLYPRARGSRMPQVLN